MSKLQTKDKLMVVGAAYLLLHVALCICLFFMGFDFTYPAESAYDRNDKDLYYGVGGWWSAVSTIACVVWFGVTD